MRFTKKDKTKLALDRTYKKWKPNVHNSRWSHESLKWLEVQDASFDKKL